MLGERIFGEEGIFSKGQDVKIAVLSIVGVIIGLCVVFTEGWRMPIFLVIAAIGIVLIFWKPYIGCLFLILLVYFPPEHHGVGGARISLILSILIMIAWIITGIRQKKLNIWYSPQLVIMGLLSLWMFIITQTAHVSVPASWEGSIKFFKVFVFCFLLVSIVNTRKKLYGIIAANCFGLTYISLQGFYYSLTGGDVRGIGGLSGDNNGVAHLLVSLFPLAVSMSFYPNKWVRLWGWFLFPMQLITIVLTNSRGGALGLGIVVIWLLFQGLREFKWKLVGITGVILFLSVVIIFGTTLGEKYTQRVETIATYEQDTGSSMKRICLWQAGLKMMKDYPITGVGLENFILTFPEYNSLHPQSTHNTYIQFGSECGIPGLGLYLLLLLFHFKTLFDIRKMVDKNSFEAYFCIALGTGIIGHMVASTFIAKAYFEPIYWLIMSGAILKKLVKQKEQVS